MRKPVKTYEYIVVFKSNSLKWVDWISKLLMFIAIISFFYSYIISAKTNNWHIDFSGVPIRYLLIAVLIITWWLYCYKLEREGKQAFYRFALLLAAIGWYNYPKGFYLCIGYLIASVLEKPVKLLPEVAIDEYEIVFNTLPIKKYKWNEVNNVVMKDGILTIDLKNNKLIQKEINDEVTIDIEKEFNTFCLKQLAEK
ncbi:MAG: hypothetical protein JSR09_07290 [Bacteroidetes bacterium]|nr:hypothetical protein [Bacteroidota bacterium]MBS1649498.1 hypothetical protein [Bacteroidota bacterium]